MRPNFPQLKERTISAFETFLNDLAKKTGDDPRNNDSFFKMDDIIDYTMMTKMSPFYKDVYVNTRKLFIESEKVADINLFDVFRCAFPHFWITGFNTTDDYTFVSWFNADDAINRHYAESKRFGLWDNKNKTFFVFKVGFLRPNYLKMFFVNLIRLVSFKVKDNCLVDMFSENCDLILNFWHKEYEDGIRYEYDSQGSTFDKFMNDKNINVSVHANMNLDRRQK